MLPQSPHCLLWPRAPTHACSGCGLGRQLVLALSVRDYRVPAWFSNRISRLVKAPSTSATTSAGRCGRRIMVPHTLICPSADAT